MNSENNEEVARLLNLLQSLNYSQRTSMINELMLSKTDLAVEVLLEALHSTENGNELGLQASVRLGQMNSKAPVLLLVQILREAGNPLVRTNAAKTLGRLKSTIAVKPLIDALQDENENVRVHSAIALGEIGDKSAVEPLLSLLKKSSNSEMPDIIGSIAELGDNRVFEPFNDILLHYKHNSDIYLYTIEMLGLLPDERAFQRLASFSLSDNKDELVAATRGLGWTQDERALPILKQLATHEDYINLEAVSLKQSVAEAIEWIERHKL